MRVINFHIIIIIIIVSVRLHLRAVTAQPPAAAAAVEWTSPPPVSTNYWQWHIPQWHVPQSSPASTRGDVVAFPSYNEEEEDIDIDSDVTFDDAVQALLTASELLARAARIVESKRFSLM